MKQSVVLAAVAVLFLAGIGAWLAMRGRTPAVPSSIDDQAIAKALTQTQEIVRNGGSGSGVVQDGKFTGAAFAMPGVENVHIETAVKGGEGMPSSSITVTLRDEQTVLLTKDSFEKIQDGMTYPQVGEALGGVMTRGRIGDGFTGNFGIVEGKRRIDLNFREGKVVKKSAQGID
jgi:hypothetical protein